MNLNPVIAAPDRKTFRAAMSRVPTSAVIVAAMHDSEPVGMVLGTFTSVSVDPVLVGYHGERSSRTVSLLLAADQVSCSLLHESQLDLVTAFERPTGSRFDGVAWEVEDQFNVPVFAGAPLTVFGCPAGMTEAGDHLFALIEVLGVHTMGSASNILRRPPEPDGSRADSRLRHLATRPARVTVP